MAKSFVNKLKLDIYPMVLGIVFGLVMCTPFIYLYGQMTQIVLLGGK